MTYLLLLDSQREESYRESTDVFLKMAYAQNKERLAYIENFELKDVGFFKMA